MKILHTSDLHVGRSLHEYPLLDDQAHVLKLLGDLLVQGEYDALFIAGDIYDRSIPSPEAVSLFSRFLSRLNREAKGCSIFIISGNHDSQTRLAYGSDIFAEQGIYVRTEPEKSWDPITLSAGGAEADIFLVPFLFPGSFSCRAEQSSNGNELSFDSLSEEGEAENMKAQNEMLSYALGQAEKKFRGKAVPVLSCHTFARGGLSCDSERIFVGSAEQVDPSLFTPFAYTALGHLHNPQRIGENAWYSGSPLSYSFSESGQEKCFLSVRIGKDSVDVEPIPIQPLRRVSRIESSFGELREGHAYDKFSGDYLEVVLTNSDIVQNASLLLKAKFPNLLSVRQKAFENSVVDIPAEAGRTEASLPEDFRRFHMFLRGTDPDEDTCGLFEKVLAEASSDETDQTGA